MITTDPHPGPPVVEEHATSNLLIMLAQPDADHLSITLPDVGPGLEPAVVPYPEPALQQIGDRLRDAPSLAREEQEQLGRTLGALLLPPGPVLAAFQAAWRDAAEHNGALRLRLQCTPALALPPWEYSYVPLIPGGAALPLLGDPRLSLVRVGAEPQDIVLPVVDDRLPLAVLLVLAEPADQPPLDLQREEQRVEAGLQQLPAGAVDEVAPLTQARWSMLQNALAGDRHIDLLHFAGHGYYGDGTPGLIFHDEEDITASHLVAAADLAAGLRGKGIKVVVLSACESARVDRAAWNGVAQQLLLAGIPAVVAMQFPVGDEEARAFAAGFYTAIATGTTVDVAVAEGRLRMAGMVPLTTGWGCPVIYMRTTEARLFHYAGPLPAALQAAQAQLVVHQVMQKVAGSVTGIDLGTVHLQDGQLVVRQEIETVEQSGSVVGLRAAVLASPAATNGDHGQGTATNGAPPPVTNGVPAPAPAVPAAAGSLSPPLRPTAGLPAAEAPAAPDSAATMPPPRPADPVMAAHLEPVEATPAVGGGTSPTAGVPLRDADGGSAAVEAVLADSRTFVERPTVENTIAAFRHSPNRTLVVVGPPGCGKTALAAWLVMQARPSPQPWLYHFCGVDEGDNPQDFIRQLAAQLAAQLPSYRISAPTLNGTTTLILQSNVQIGANAGTVEGIHTGDISLGEAHPREAFRRLIQQPLKDYRREAGPDGQPIPLVIVVDALDRAWEWDGGQSGNIVALLSDAQDMPPWVNFICTARPGSAVQALRARGGVQILNLGEDVATTIKDITHYLLVEWQTRLEPAARSSLLTRLQTIEPYKGLPAPDGLQALATTVAAATEGSFLYARRFVDTLHSALSSAGSPEGLDPTALLQHPEQLDAALAGAYNDVLGQLRRSLEIVHDPGADDLLAVLAVAFAPLSQPLLAMLAGHDLPTVQTALDRLNSVLSPPAAGATPRYALYSRSFADYLRTQLPEGGRVWDRKLAELLETLADTGDAELTDYRARFRWRHLQRGLQLVPPPDDSPGTKGAHIALPDLTHLDEQVLDPLLRARVLRAQALALLDAGSMRANAWTTAIALLQAAETGIMGCRALAPVRRGRRLHWTDHQRSSQTEAALEELERTLVARGDAYTIIGDQLLGTDEMRPLPPGGPLRGLVVLWGMLLRLPTLLYCAIPLRQSGLTLKDLALGGPWICRGRDWSVVRLVMRALRSYTRAAIIADHRGDPTSAEEIKDRIAQLYMRCDALNGAATAFNDLLAGPSTIDRPWQEALWRLRLGEALSRLGKVERAAPLLESALRQFISQDAPLPQARTYNALVYVHVRKAQLLRLRDDEQNAAGYEDLALRRAEEGLAAWNRLSTLEGDEITQVDPAAGRSRLLGAIWRLRQSNMLAEEQQRRATALLAPAIERHFPQRFEHPLLHWFQAASLIVTPLLLLVGLLLAVQLPSTLEFVPARAHQLLQPPLVDLAGFPDNLVGGLGALKAGQALTLVQSTDRLSGQIVLRTGTALVHPVATLLDIARGVLTAILLYVVAGLLFILLSEPNTFQNYRPGRLVLTADAIIWRGTPISGSRWRTWRALFLRSLTTIRSRIWQRAVVPAAIPTSDGPAEASPEQRLAYRDVDSTLVLERRVNGMVVYDLSHQVLLPITSSIQPLVVDGSVARYDELVDELKHRIVVPQHRLAGDLVRSWPGRIFMLTVTGIVIVLGLAAFAPAALLYRLPRTAFHLNELYILVTPGLVLPLMWIFVWQPLAGLTIRYLSHSFALCALVCSLFVTALLALGIDLSLVGLNPDLLLPLLAIGLGLTAIGLLGQRRRVGPSQRRLPGHLMTLVALVPLLFCVNRVIRDGRWYRNLIIGNRALELAGSDPTCIDPQCPALKDADVRYRRMTELRPTDPEGYGARGFAALQAGATISATTYFQNATNRLPLSFVAARRNLAASLGEVFAREAEKGQSLPPATAYRQAWTSYSGVLPRLHAALQASPVPAGFEQCFSPRAATTAPADTLPLGAGDERYALQDADTLYSRAAHQITALEHPELPVTNYYVHDRESGSEVISTGGGAPQPFDCRPVRAWEDLGAAIRIYGALLSLASADTSLAHDSAMGLAAAWLERGNFPPAVRPVDAPGVQSSYMSAQAAYRQAVDLAPDDPEAEAGVGLTAILLNAWDQAQYPLKQAQTLAPQDPRYPSFSALAWWLQGDRLAQDAKGSTLPAGYERLLLHAIEQYTVALTETDLLRPGNAPASTTNPASAGQYYAMRSILYFNLRATPADPHVGSADADIANPTGEARVGYNDNAALPRCATDNYDIWMQRAIRDMDQAIDVATVRQRTPGEAAASAADLVVFHYWRGRLHTALALTWQKHLCGSHPWRTILPEYSAAVDDFTSGTLADVHAKRKESYTTQWLVWSQYLARNAARLALVEAAIDDALDHPTAGTADFSRAHDELQVVDTADPTGNDSGPTPDYYSLSGIVALATGMPITNSRATKATTLTAAEAYEQAINEIVVNVPRSQRPQLWTDMLQRLERFLAAPAVPVQVQRDGRAILNCLQQAKVGTNLDTISCAPQR